MVVSLGLEVGYPSPGALVLRAARLRLQCLHYVCGPVLAAEAGTGHCLRDVAVELCRYAEGALYPLTDNRRSNWRHACYWRHLCAVFLPLFDCRQRSWSVFGLAILTYVCMLVKLGWKTEIRYQLGISLRYKLHHLPYGRYSGIILG